MRKTHLSVIIPCYNEVENLRRGVLRDVYEFMKKQEYSWEAIVSDDGSTDGSVQIIRKQIKHYSNFTLLTNPHGSKPSALWFGIKKAKGEFVLFCDMDQSTPITELTKLTPFLKKFKIVIGSRGMDRKNFPLYRKAGSVVFMTLRKIFLLKDINDTQCGFKLFKRDVVEKAFPKLEFFRNKKEVKGWKVTSYDVELLHIIEKAGGKLKEVKVAWRDADTSITKGGGLQRYFGESKEMLIQIFRVKYNDLRGLYD